jgi:hypothetical protein
VNTYGTRIATVLQCCLLLVLCPQAASPQSNAAAPPISQSNASQSTVPTPDRPARLVPRTAEDRERTFRAEHHVILNVFVADASGNPVTGLRQEDFTLLDNQQPQTIASFKAMTGSTPMAPAHVLLMLDSLNNSASSIAYARKELENFLGRNHGSLANPVSGIVDISVDMKTELGTGMFSRGRGSWKISLE